MSSILKINDRIRKDTSNGENPTKYGILVDTDLSRICVLQFSNHQDLLDLILSHTYPNLILYRTQYHPPSDEELEDLNERLFTE